LFIFKNLFNYYLAITCFTSPHFNIALSKYGFKIYASLRNQQAPLLLAVIGQHCWYIFSFSIF